MKKLASVGLGLLLLSQSLFINVPAYALSLAEPDPVFKEAPANPSNGGDLEFPGGILPPEIAINPENGASINDFYIPGELINDNNDQAEDPFILPPEIIRNPGDSDLDNGAIPFPIEPVDFPGFDDTDEANDPVILPPEAIDSPEQEDGGLIFDEPKNDTDGETKNPDGKKDGGFFFDPLEGDDQEDTEPQPEPENDENFDNGDADQEDTEPQPEPENDEDFDNGDEDQEDTEPQPEPENDEDFDNGDEDQGTAEKDNCDPAEIAEALKLEQHVLDMIEKVVRSEESQELIQILEATSLEELASTRFANILDLASVEAQLAEAYSDEARSNILYAAKARVVYNAITFFNFVIEASEESITDKLYQLIISEELVQALESSQLLIVSFQTKCASRLNIADIEALKLISLLDIIAAATTNLAGEELYDYDNGIDAENGILLTQNLRHIDLAMTSLLEAASYIQQTIPVKQAIINKTKTDTNTTATDDDDSANGTNSTPIANKCDTTPLEEAYKQEAMVSKTMYEKFVANPAYNRLLELLDAQSLWKLDLSAAELANFEALNPEFKDKDKKEQYFKRIKIVKIIQFFKKHEKDLTKGQLDEITKAANTLKESITNLESFKKHCDELDLLTEDQLKLLNGIIAQDQKSIATLLKLKDEVSSLEKTMSDVIEKIDSAIKGKTGTSISSYIKLMLLPLIGIGAWGVGLIHAIISASIGDLEIDKFFNSIKAHISKIQFLAGSVRRDMKGSRSGKGTLAEKAQLITEHGGTVPTVPEEIRPNPITGSDLDTAMDINLREDYFGCDFEPLMNAYRQELNVKNTVASILSSRQFKDIQELIAAKDLKTLETLSLTLGISFLDEDGDKFDDFEDARLYLLHRYLLKHTEFFNQLYLKINLIIGELFGSKSNIDRLKRECAKELSKDEIAELDKVIQLDKAALNAIFKTDDDNLSRSVIELIKLVTQLTVEIGTATEREDQKKGVLPEGDDDWTDFLDKIFEFKAIGRFFVFIFGGLFGDDIEDIFVDSVSKLITKIKQDLKTAGDKMPDALTKKYAILIKHVKVARLEKAGIKNPNPSSAPSSSDTSAPESSSSSGDSSASSSGSNSNASDSNSSSTGSGSDTSDSEDSSAPAEENNDTEEDNDETSDEVNDNETDESNNDETAEPTVAQEPAPSRQRAKLSASAISINMNDKNSDVCDITLVDPNKDEFADDANTGLNLKEGSYAYKFSISKKVFIANADGSLVQENGKAKIITVRTGALLNIASPRTSISVDADGNAEIIESQASVDEAILSQIYFEHGLSDDQLLVVPVKVAATKASKVIITGYTAAVIGAYDDTEELQDTTADILDSSESVIMNKSHFAKKKSKKRKNRNKKRKKKNKKKRNKRA